MVNKNLSRLADNIRKQRLQNFYTEKEIAEKLGISEETYMEIETGKQYPDPSIFSALSGIFCCSLNDTYEVETIPFVTRAEEAISSVLYGVRLGNNRSDYEFIDFWTIYGSKKIGGVLKSFFKAQENENETVASLIKQLAADADRFWGNIQADDSAESKSVRIQAGYSFCSEMICLLEKISNPRRLLKTSELVLKIQSSLKIDNSKEACRVLIMEWFVPFIQIVQNALGWSGITNPEGALCLDDRGFQNAVLYDFYDQLIME